jgi:hypothetical protein
VYVEFPTGHEEWLMYVPRVVTRAASIDIYD